MAAEEQRTPFEPGEVAFEWFDQRVELPDGRGIALRIWRPEAEQPVVLLAASPGSRFFDPDPEVGIRLIAVDRPGYGASDPTPIPTLGALADDVAVALASLQLGPVPVVGWSAGGRIALALAARHPHLVSRIALVSTPAPDDEVEWISPETRDLVHQLRLHPDRALGTLIGLFHPLASRPDPVAAVSAGPADERALEDAGLRRRLEEMVAEALAPGVEGVAADLLAGEVAEWDFSLDDVQAEVYAFYGTQDTLVGPLHGEWYLARLPAARLFEVADAGHLVVATHWEEIVATVTDHPFEGRVE